MRLNLKSMKRIILSALQTTINIYVIDSGAVVRRINCWTRLTKLLKHKFLSEKAYQRTEQWKKIIESKVF